MSRGTEFFASFQQIVNLEQYFTGWAIVCSKYTSTSMKYFIRELTVDEFLVHVKLISDSIERENEAMQRLRSK